MPSFLHLFREVQHSVSVVSALHQRWEELVSHRDASADPQELDWTTSELHSQLRSIEWDLQDLDETISVVESNASKFRLDANEIDNRKKFISDTRTKVRRIRDALQREEKGGRMNAQKRDALFDGRTRAESVASSSGIDLENTAFVENETQKQKLLVAEQDETLDELGAAAERLGEMGLTINEELEEQNRMLDDLDHEVDTTQFRLRDVQARVSKILKSKDRGKFCCVVILFLILLVLIALTVYTA